METIAKRVLAIGLDSAEPELIEKWAEEGKLPVFERLMKEGCYGRLNSTIPPLTPPAWTTAFTGVNPGKHNIYDFFQVTDQHAKEMVCSSDRRSKALWHLLDETGRKSLVVNLPITYPADEFNGVMVAGMPMPRQNTGFVSPESRREEILEIIDNKPLGVSEKHIITGDVDSFLTDLEEVTERISRLTHHLLRAEDWSLCAVVFDDLDRLQHLFWHYMDPSHPFHDPDKKDEYGNVLLNFYKSLEKQIESFFPLLEDGRTLLMVFSDHGMGPVYRNVSVNTFFLQKGWLKTKNQGVVMREVFDKIGISFEDVRIILDRLRLRPLLRRIVPLSVKNKLRQWVPAESADLDIINWSGTLDWSESKAYLCSRTGHGIMINRENVDDYERFRDEVIAALMGVKDPDTGKPVVRKVYRREEVFQGPCTDDAPDLIVEVEDTYQVQEKIGESVVAPLQAARVPISANHQQEGMLAVTGAGLTRTGHRIAGANIADIAPTILYSLGLSIPADMDGTLVADAFREDVLSTRPAAISGPSLQTDAGNGELAADEEAEIKKRLRDLGYLE